MRGLPGVLSSSCDVTMMSGKSPISSDPRLAGVSLAPLQFGMDAIYWVILRYLSNPYLDYTPC